ncbi:hypothetical protein Y032_0373g169 [Ancylostoma ceylanicum]|uniref:Uncharacterized protein n=1 Tax=Ancylostoma ceylanicum TaxID=53326 RepID=A0A016RTU3_9BILA|nr:hypothetical protein Y032_0373g169 [Ancylostoma ceylanicum]
MNCNWRRLLAQTTFRRVLVKRFLRHFGVFQVYHWNQHVELAQILLTSWSREREANFVRVGQAFATPLMAYPTVVRGSAKRRNDVPLLINWACRRTTKKCRCPTFKSSSSSPLDNATRDDDMLTSHRSKKRVEEAGPYR